MSNGWRTRRMIPLALLFSLSVAGCAQSPSSTADQPTAAAPAAVPAITAVPSPVATAASPSPGAVAQPTAAAPAASAAPSAAATASSTFTSEGLGVPRAKWDIHHEPDTGDQNTVSYDGKTYLITFLSGNVVAITQFLGTTGVSVDQARSSGKALIPADSKLAQTYAAQDKRTVDLYHSDMLKDRFPDQTTWPGGQPGDFIIVYNQAAGGSSITSISIATGNSPQAVQ